MTDMVHHPPHYERGPVVSCPHCDTAFTVQHIQCFRHIKDPRLATAFKYLWRVAFGGKADDIEDIDKAIFYLTDWKDHPA